MRPPNRTTLAIALLFAIPPGIGIWLATLRVTGGGEPTLAIVAGTTSAVALFLFVLLLGGYGRVE